MKLNSIWKAYQLHWIHREASVGESLKAEYREAFRGKCGWKSESRVQGSIQRQVWVKVKIQGWNWKINFKNEIEFNMESLSITLNSQRGKCGWKSESRVQRSIRGKCGWKSESRVQRSIQRQVWVKVCKQSTEKHSEASVGESLQADYREAFHEVRVC
jgi:hypothetical protein